MEQITITTTNAGTKRFTLFANMSGDGYVLILRDFGALPGLKQKCPEVRVAVTNVVFFAFGASDDDMTNAVKITFQTEDEAAFFNIREFMGADAVVTPY